MDLRRFLTGFRGQRPRSAAQSEEAHPFPQVPPLPPNHRSGNRLPGIYEPTPSPSGPQRPWASGPPPSLWPEPSSPERSGPESTTFTIPNRTTADASRAVDMGEGAPSPLSTDEAAADAGLRCSTVDGPSEQDRHLLFPSPIAFTPDSPDSPVNITYFPDWYAYPSASAPGFNVLGTSTWAPCDKLEDLTTSHLRQSAALQEWMTGKEVAKSQLRQSEKYRGLLQARLFWQESAAQAYTAAHREEAELHLQMTEVRISEEEKNIARAESSIAVEIGNAYAAFVAGRNLEGPSSPPRHPSNRPTSAPRPERILSRVERLLGADGTVSPPKPKLTSPTWSNLYGSPHGIVKMSYEDGVEQGIEGLKAPHQSKQTEKDIERLVPEWFDIFERRGVMQLDGVTRRDRFKTLCNYIYKQENDIRALRYQEEHPEEDVLVLPKLRYKNWHDPHPAWGTELHRQRGGWWNCRDLPDPNYVERACRLCELPTPRPTSAQERLDRVWELVAKASAEVAQRDKNVVLAGVRSAAADSAAGAKAKAKAKDKAGAGAEERRQSDEEAGLWMKQLRRDLQVFEEAYDNNSKNNKREQQGQGQKVPAARTLINYDYDLLRGVPGNPEAQRRN
ncbi:hypothetical protein GGR56DRAFT_341167 [Xylariaceae sp. FL0804]|nr:hypothetical protein GGR56DRAFT_341167 [Xylariaceae sp. FL0804]